MKGAFRKITGSQGSDFRLTSLAHTVHLVERYVLLFQKCALLMETWQAAAFRPLKNKLHVFALVIKVKIVMFCMCLTINANSIFWSAMYFKSNPFRKKVRRLSGGEGFQITHPVGYYLIFSHFALGFCAYIYTYILAFKEFV